MVKTLLVALTMTIACATSDKAVAPRESGTVSHAVSDDGTKIAFDKVGGGPALVIIGGALSDRRGGQPLADALADRFTVYTYDRRGRGDSGDTAPYAVDREIEDLGAIIEQAGGTAYVYGVSSGAALALRSAAQLGAAKVSKLAVYEPPYGQDEREFREQKERIDQLVKAGPPGEAAAFFLSTVGMPPEALEKMKGSPEWGAISKIDFTLSYDYLVLGDGGVPRSVALVTVPTLVMNGANSLPFMHPTADRIAQLMPNARRKTLEGQTHQATPAAVVPVLVEFFTGQTP